MENININEIFNKLTQEQKEAFNKIVKKYNGTLNIHQILYEIKSEENTYLEKMMYQYALFISVLLCKRKIDEYEKEDGKEHSYMVAMLCGGVAEDPCFHYECEQIITAKSKKEAEEKYNKVNNCNYYRGEVLAQLD